jgi:hypothetical protein
MQWMHTSIKNKTLKLEVTKSLGICTGGRPMCIYRCVYTHAHRVTESSLQTQGILKPFVVPWRSN